MHHFEFMLPLITSGLRDLSSWNLVQVSFLEWEVQKSHLEYKKTNQCSVISHFKFPLCLTRSGTGKVCGTTVIPKNFFSSETKDINLTFCQNWDWVLFQIFQNKVSNLRHFLGPLNKSFLALVTDWCIKTKFLWFFDCTY